MNELANECKRAGGTPKHQIKDFDNMKHKDLRKPARDLGVAQMVNKRMRLKKELTDECKRAGGTSKHQICDFDNMKENDLSNAAHALGMAQMVNKRMRSRKADAADEIQTCLGACRGWTCV